MKYAEIKNYDIANGPGVRTTLFVSGCRHHCKGCFNPETWSFNFGNEFDEKTIDCILDYMKPDYIAGLSILGGDPFEPENIWGVYDLVEAVTEQYPDKTIWIYTGCTYEEIRSPEFLENADIVDKDSYRLTANDILRMIDVLVDGEFIEEEKDLSIKFRGSRNQRLIDMKKTLMNRKVTMTPEHYEGGSFR